MNCYFTHLSFENKSFNSYNITYIQKMLEYSIVHCFVITRAYIIAPEIDLDSS